MELPDYERSILNDPLMLLENFRLLVYTTIRATYPMMPLSHVMSRLVNLRKKYNEDILDYLERLRNKGIFLRSNQGGNFRFIHHKHNGAY